MSILEQIYLYGFSTFYMIFLIIFGVSLILAIITKVPFVPTPKRTILKLLKLADLKDGQTVYDLGCGDGRLLYAAEKKAKITAIGYEISPIPYIMATVNKKIHGSKAKIIAKNFFKEDLSNADVVFTYLIPDILPKLTEKLKKECKKGTIVISHTFKLPDLKIVKDIPKDRKAGYPHIFVYEV